MPQKKACKPRKRRKTQSSFGALVKKSFKKSQAKKKKQAKAQRTKDLSRAKKGIAPSKTRAVPEWKGTIRINKKNFFRIKSTNSANLALREFNKLEKRKQKGVIKSIRLKEDKTGLKNKRFALFVHTKSNRP